MGTQLNLFGFESNLRIISSFDHNPVIIYEYFLLISPSVKIKQQVREFKQKLHQKIGLSLENQTSVPHISLMLLKENSERDHHIVEKAKDTLTGMEDFNIQINGLQTFEHTYTKDLVLKVESKEINELFHSICKKFDLRTPKTFVPHLTIARGIPKNRIEKIGDLMHEFELHADFLCSNITVLKRKVEITSRDTKKSIYSKICDVPLNSGIKVNRLLKTA
jgi:2'-5' RNA ligase